MLLRPGNDDLNPDVDGAKDPNFDFGEARLQLAIVTVSTASLSGASPACLMPGPRY